MTSSDFWAKGLFRSITQAIDDDFPVDILFLDFAKAFDTVVHTRLSKKLIKYGFVDGLLAWLMAFLSNRFQRVILGENISEWIKVLSGVPQGSVLAKYRVLGPSTTWSIALYNFH